MKTIAAAAALLTLADSASAKTLVEARAEPPTVTVQSTHSLFDVERCIIGSDMMFLPVVYSQPDRPNEREIVSGGAGQGIRYLFKLTATPAGTTVAGWAQSGKMKPDFVACL